MSGNKSQEFLDHIVTRPDDDAPRLVFADWLEEHGEAERADFIRVQIERARLPAWDARQVPLRLREAELLERHGGAWRAELPAIEGVHWGAFRRGFVASAGLATVAGFHEQMSACRAAAPVEAVDVSWPHREDAVETVAPLAGLRELTIRGQFLDLAGAARLANAPLLSTLRILNAGGTGLHVGGFRQLATSPHLGQLTALRVPYNSLGNGVADALSDAKTLTSLEELDLTGASPLDHDDGTPVLEASGLAALAVWPGLSRLRVLKLAENDVRHDGLRALLRSPRAAGLKELVVRENGLDGPAMAEFGSAPPCLQLDVLDVSLNVLRDVGAGCLARAGCLRELKVLHLASCGLTSAGVRGLARAPFVVSLRHLSASFNSLGPNGLAALLDANPRELNALWLANNDLGDEGVARLAAAPASDSLRELNLSQNHLGDEAAQSLARSKHLRNLLVLYLEHNQIGPQGKASLEQSPLGKRLAVLSGAGDPGVTF